MTNKDLDKWIAENVMGWTIIDELHIKDNNGNYVFDGSPWHPTKSISDAFQVVEKIHEAWGFSKRGLFLKALQEVVSNGIVELTKSKQMIVWPYLLFYITPKAICLAAKQVVEEIE